MTALERSNNATQLQSNFEVALNEQLAWHEGLKHFKTEREREAYKQGFTQAWIQASQNALEMAHKLVTQ